MERFERTLFWILEREREQGWGWGERFMFTPVPNSIWDDLSIWLSLPCKISVFLYNMYV